MSGNGASAANTSARIAFAGTPGFAVPCLAALARSGAAIPFVLTQPDRPAGRGRRLAPSPVKQQALEIGVAVHQPERIADRRLLESLGAPPDLLVVVAYGLLLPPWLLDWPRFGCVNVHASLLPRWRGAAPIQRALLAGDARTGVSLMQMTPGLDSGPVYARRALAIDPAATAGDLHDQLAELGAALLGEALPALLNRQLAAEPQDETEVTLAPKLSKREAVLDWHQTAVLLARAVRAFNPWPVAESTLTDGRRLRIWRAEPLPTDAGAAPGTVVATGPDGIDVATGRGRLRLTRVQAPGAKPMPASAYLAAHALEGVTFVA